MRGYISNNSILEFIDTEKLNYVTAGIISTIKPLYDILPIEKTIYNTRATFRLIKMDNEKYALTVTPPPIHLTFDNLRDVVNHLSEENPFNFQE